MHDALTALRALGHETRLFKDGHVLLHGRERHVVPRGERGDRRGFPAKQPRDDVAAGGIGKSVEKTVGVGTGESGTYNHMVVYNPG